MSIYDVYRSRKPDHSDSRYVGTVKARDARQALRLAHAAVDAAPGELWVDGTDADDMCRGVKWIGEA